MTPKNDKPWKTYDSNARNPKLGEIYHVAFYEWYAHQWCIGLTEIANTIHNESGFEPVDMTDKEVHELVEQSISIEQPA